jgi:hypothetical protein
VLARRTVLAVRARTVLLGFLAALAVVHAIVAAWTPVQGDDWLHWVWHARRSGVGAFAVAHFEFSELVGYLLARAPLVHVIVSPLVAVALIVGLFTVAMRRLPRATWSDTLGVALASATLWIAQPDAGFAWFYAPSVALHVYGAAAAAWFVAPWRCGWTVPRRLWPLLALAGYCAGTSSRAIAAATFVGTALALRGRVRQRWMWIAFGGLAVGTAVGFARPPWLEIGRIVRRGFEQNLVVAKLSIEESGRLVALVLALVVANACLVATRRPAAAADERPDTGDALKWFVGWFATALLCLFGPRYYEATTFPATCMVVVAALPALLWLATARPLRIVLVTFAIAVHAFAWTMSLVQYHRFGAEGAERLAILANTPPGRVASVPPYSQVLPTFWFFGDDFDKPRTRGLVAAEVFGLQTIDVAPPFRRYERDPGIAFALQVDAVTPDQLAAAAPPSQWSGVPPVAREQFTAFVQRLRAVTGKPVAARLAVTNVMFSELGTRPLLAAWVAGDETVIPRTAISPVDENNEYTIRMYEALKLFGEAWFVADGKATQTPYRNGAPRIRPATPHLHAIVVCNASRCLLEDAFVPRF